MTPAVHGYRLLMGCLLGAVLGLWYGFLRPLRKIWLKDLLFVIAGGWLWLILAFAVCRGDLRLGYVVGMGLCCIVWERTMGQNLIPFFAGIWDVFGAIFIPLKKFLVFLKKLFASAQK